MNTNLTITVPEAWLRDALPDYDCLRGDEEALREACRALLLAGLHENIVPVEHEDLEPGAATQRMSIRLPDLEWSILRGRAKKEAGLTPAPFARLLLGAMRNRVVPQTPVDPHDPMVRLTAMLTVRDPHVVLRREQVQVAANLRDALHQKKFGLVEAGTGVGKTLAMVATALGWIYENQKRIVIAAPTIAVMRQFAAEYARVAPVAEALPLRIIFGRREFVSEEELLALLGQKRELSDREAALAWLEAKGPSPHAADGVDTRWLVSALDHVAPGFPVDEVRVSALTAANDQGYIAYRSQFKANLADAEVILCTHAMLAQDMRLRLFAAARNEDFKGADRQMRELFGQLKEAEAAHRPALLQRVRKVSADRAERFATASAGLGLLPEYRALFVDEAHLLEQNFAGALSDYLSLKAIVRHLRDYRSHGGRITNDTIDRIEGYVDEITAVGRDIQRDLVVLAASTPAVSRANVLLALIVRELEQVPMPRRHARDADSGATLADVPDKTATRIRAALHVHRALRLVRSTLGSGNVRAWLRFSPQRAFPQIYVGNSSVETILRTMWNSLDGGAAVSATLYLRRADGVSASYQRMLLGLPEDRYMEYPPVHSGWNAAPVVGIWTAGQLSAMLRPPTRADRLSEKDHARAEDRWLDGLAPVIRGIHESAQGGVLVLMTSYKALNGVAQRLDDLGGLLVCAADGFPVVRLAEAFLRMRHTGARPLWLAVGGAWTGIDVGGHEPWSRLFTGEKISAREDNVLTDLVVPRLPFGTNQSMTHLWRIQNRAGVPWDLLEAAFRLKQGLGRLVRRSGLPANRRIFVLDGRLQDTGAASAYALFRQLMAPYQPRELDASTVTVAQET